MKPIVRRSLINKDKAVIVVLLVAAILVSGCLQQPRGLKPDKTQIPEQTKVKPEQRVDTKDYVFFAINTQDWPYYEKSIEIINKLIDLHETYNVPVDIYVTDPIFQKYVKYAPDLVKRLSTSPVVAISYHNRPPTPYAYTKRNYLENFEENKQKEIVLDYEEHKLNLETGETEDAPGGYQFVKDTIGYAPYCVAGFYSSPSIVSSIYKEKGAKCAVYKGFSQSMYSGLIERPETIELKWYEYVYMFSVS